MAVIQRAGVLAGAGGVFLYTVWVDEYVSLPETLFPQGKVGILRHDELTGNCSAKTDSAYDQVPLRSFYIWQDAIQSKSWALIGLTHPDEVLLS